MKLFLVERTDDCDYDEHDGAVIRAESEEEVISKLFTLTERGREQLSHYDAFTYKTIEENTAYLLKTGYNLYGLDGFTRENTTVTELMYDGDAGIVLASFNAG